MYGSSRRKVSEQRRAVPKPPAKKRVVKVKKAKVEANKRVVEEEKRKSYIGRFDGPRVEVGSIASSLIVSRTLTGAKREEMKNKFREWRKKNENKTMTLAQAQRNFNAFASGPPARAPPARPAPKRPRNGNGNGNGNGGKK